MQRANGHKKKNKVTKFRELDAGAGEGCEEYCLVCKGQDRGTIMIMDRNVEQSERPSNISPEWRAAVCMVDPEARGSYLG